MGGLSGFLVFTELQFTVGSLVANEMPKDRLLFLSTNHRAPPDGYITSVQARIIVFRGESRGFSSSPGLFLDILLSSSGIPRVSSERWRQISSPIRLYRVVGDFESLIVV